MLHRGQMPFICFSGMINVNIGPNVQQVTSFNIYSGKPPPPGIDIKKTF